MELKTPPAGCVKAIALPVLLHDHYFKTSIFSAKRCCCFFFFLLFFCNRQKVLKKLCCSSSCAVLRKLEDIDFPIIIVWLLGKIKQWFVLHIKPTFIFNNHQLFSKVLHKCRATFINFCAFFKVVQIGSSWIRKDQDESD